MTFAQRRNRLTTHFSERIPVVKRRISVLNVLFLLAQNEQFNSIKIHTMNDVRLFFWREAKVASPAVEQCSVRRVLRSVLICPVVSQVLQATPNAHWAHVLYVARVFLWCLLRNSTKMQLAEIRCVEIAVSFSRIFQASAVNERALPPPPHIQKLGLNKNGPYYGLCLYSWLPRRSWQTVATVGR
jgi:hypothetical protein